MALNVGATSPEVIGYLILSFSFGPRRIRLVVHPPIVARRFLRSPRAESPAVRATRIKNQLLFHPRKRRGERAESLRVVYEVVSTFSPRINLS